MNANDPNVWPKQPSQYSPATPTNGPGQPEADELHTEGRDLAPSQGNFARLPWLRAFLAMSYVSIYQK
jgi:hypothetical protein